MKTKVINTLPKLHLCAGNDDLRPVMQYVQVVKTNEETILGIPGTYAVATNAHLLAWAELGTYLGNKPGDINELNLPEHFYIHSSAWKKLTSKKVVYIEYDNGHIKTYDKTGNILDIVPVMTEDIFNDKIGRFPYYTPVIESIKESIETKPSVNLIAFNSGLLCDLCNLFEGDLIRWFLNANNRGQMIEYQVLDKPALKCIIMPLIVNV